jgi:nitroreductase
MTERHDVGDEGGSWPATGVDFPSVPDLTGWFVRRDTVRHFDPDAEIPDEELREMVDAGRKAPTSGTLQMYSFVRIRDADARERIHGACEWGQPQVEESSQFLLVCIDLRRLRHLHEHADLSFEMTPMSALLKGSVDASLAAQGVMTVAESRGYGVCPIGAIGANLSDVAAEADLPSGVLPIWGLCIGVPADDGPTRGTSRVPLEAVLHDGSYEEPTEELLEGCYAVMNERYDPETGRTWDGTLANYWSEPPEGVMNERESELLKAMDEQGFFEYRSVDVEGENR